MDHCDDLSVLAVEDDELVASLVLTVLRADSRFSTVRHATTVASARELIASAFPDVVLVDHDLPDGTAADVLEAVNAAGCGAPVVLHSARPDVHHKAASLGCAAAIEKPDWRLVPDALARAAARRRESTHPLCGRRGPSTLQTAPAQSVARSRQDPSTDRGSR